MELVAYSIISLAVVADVASFVLGLRRLRGNGPSGVPVLGSIIVCVAACLLVFCGEINWPEARWGIGLYFLSQLVIQIGVLFLIHLMWDYLPFTRWRIDADSQPASDSSSSAGNAPATLHEVAKHGSIR